MNKKNVAMAWIKGDKCKASHSYIDGRTCFSYGSHFPIAHKAGGITWLFNTTRYSNTTSKHQSEVRRAIPLHIQVVECDTEEIKRAIDNPDSPILITKERGITSLDHALELVKTYCRSRGMKVFPMKFLKTYIEKKVIMQNI